MNRTHSVAVLTLTQVDELFISYLELGGQYNAIRNEHQYRHWIGAICVRGER